MENQRKDVVVVLITLLPLLLLWVFGATATDQVTLAGQLTATDQEAAEGYFQIGTRKNMVVAEPGSELHVWLKNKLRQRVRLTVMVETDTTN